MNFAADEIALQTKLSTVLTAAAITLPVDYPGMKADAVNGKIIRVRFGHVPQTRNAQLGSTRVRKYGSMLVQIVLPTGKGKKELLQIADVIALGFYNFKSGGLRCNPASYQDGEEESGFITGTVDVPYISDYSS